MWVFDQSVAGRFQQEAESNIPDYYRVIDMCLCIAQKKGFSDEINVIDIGSALGYTVNRFIEAGFPHTFGIESSLAMLDKSMHKDRIIISNIFPKIPCEFVMANWTLHFIDDRKQYIQDIYDNMVGGVFILSDKTIQTKEVKEMYYDFKLSNGVSIEYIMEKEHKLKGYMNLMSVDWYMNTLKEVGFKNIQIINAKLGFVTFYAEK